MSAIFFLMLVHQIEAHVKYALSKICTVRALSLHKQRTDGTHARCLDAQGSRSSIGERRCHRYLTYKCLMHCILFFSYPFSYFCDSFL